METMKLVLGVVLCHLTVIYRNNKTYEQINLKQQQQQQHRVVCKQTLTC